MAASYIPNDLHILNACNQVYVKEKSPGWRGNKYEVRTMQDQVLFKLKDEKKFLQLAYNVDMVAYDTQGMKMFSFRLPSTWNRKKLVVSVMDQVVAVIRQESTYIKPVLYINDPQDSHMLRIKGDSRELKFKIQTVAKETIGSLDKVVKWFGRDKYRITFPPNLDVTMKIVLIGACILIDYAYHNNENYDNN